MNEEIIKYFVCQTQNTNQTNQQGIKPMELSNRLNQLMRSGNQSLQTS
jgi:hypothetical protein